MGKIENVQLPYSCFLAETPVARLYLGLRLMIVTEGEVLSRYSNESTRNILETHP